jgi:hypothetical protein
MWPLIPVPAALDPVSDTSLMSWDAIDCAVPEVPLTAPTEMRYEYSFASVE